MSCRLRTGVDLAHGVHMLTPGMKSYQKDAYAGDSKPVAKLWATLLKALGSKNTKFDDSTGTIDQIIV